MQRTEKTAVLYKQANHKSLNLPPYTEIGFLKFDLNQVDES